MARSDGTIGAIPQDDILVFSIATATQAVDSIVWQAPYPCKLVRVSVVFQTASSSGTLNVEKCPVGTAAGSGTDMLSSTISLAGTAAVTVNGTLTTTQSTLKLAATDRLALDFGGTVTNLANCFVTIHLRRLLTAGADR